MRNIITTLCAIISCSVIIISCAKELSNETGDYDFFADGSIATDSAGFCTGATVVGTFYNGVSAGSDTAYVNLQLNVTKVGKYSITTSTTNGYLFADSGNLNDTGLQTIRLKQVGVAIIPISDTFFVGFDSSFCQFVVHVQDSAGVIFPEDTTGNSTLTLADSIPENSWTFIDDTLTYSGVVQIAEFNVSNELIIFGDYGIGDTSLSVKIGFPTAAITKGTYSTNNPVTEFNYFDLKNSTTILQANILTIPAAIVDYEVAYYNSITKMVKIIFEGNSLKEGTKLSPILRGAINLQIK